MYGESWIPRIRAWSVPFRRVDLTLLESASERERGCASALVSKCASASARMRS